MRAISGDRKKIGLVSEINDNIILVDIEDINVRKNMEVIGASTYYFGPGNSGYNNLLNDLKDAIEYMTEKNDSIYTTDLKKYNEEYSSLLADSLYCNSGCVQTRGQEYTLRVINVIDSIAVTKLIDRNNPWVQIRINDKVYVSPN